MSDTDLFRVHSETLWNFIMGLMERNNYDLHVHAVSTPPLPVSEIKLTYNHYIFIQHVQLYTTKKFVFLREGQWGPDLAPFRTGQWRRQDLVRRGRGLNRP